VATLLGVQAAAVRIVAGPNSRDKVVEVTGLDMATLQGVLDAANG
jgi:hypothetical protein